MELFARKSRDIMDEAGVLRDDDLLVHSNKFTSVGHTTPS